MDSRLAPSVAARARARYCSAARRRACARPSPSVPLVPLSQPAPRMPPPLSPPPPPLSKPEPCLPCSPAPESPPPRAMSITSPDTEVVRVDRRRPDPALLTLVFHTAPLILLSKLPEPPCPPDPALE